MPSILVVEDEPAIAESIAYSLRRDGYSRADRGDRGRRGARSARRGPRGPRPDAARRQRLRGARRRAAKPQRAPPIIVLSSRDSEADRVAALETGADDYVTKPFSPREIVARVRAVLRRAGPRARHAEGRPRPGVPLVVDEATRRATVHGKPLELTRVEFDLLACLLAAPGRVFTRAQLIDKVWGDGFAITDRTIDSHVKGLRRRSPTPAATRASSRPCAASATA
jgi:DNA-binding response OmpR family regulator